MTDRLNRVIILLTGAVILYSGLVTPADALQAGEVLVLANRNAAKSVGLARYYMKKRQIPEQNLLILWTTDREACSRSEYEQKIVPPVKRYLSENRQIRCLVTMYGLPLRISPTPLSDADRNTHDGYVQRKKELTAALAAVRDSDPDKANGYKKALQDLEQQIRHFNRSRDTVASLDSELMLVLKDDYNLTMWIPNPYFLGFQNRKTGVDKSDVRMTSRLDGPDPDTVRRIIDDALQAEKQGLKGRAYFDARWKDPADNAVSGYALYDRSIHRAAAELGRTGKRPVVIDDTEELFQPGDCPQAAFYVGWYRLARYLDAFDWVPGSVGYHIASQECQSLKQGSYWCVNMLKDGITATIGPVGEPYVQSFPLPEIFFSHLAEGYLTLAECYLISLPYLSWKMVLVGDPLYRVNLVKQ